VSSPPISPLTKQSKNRSAENPTLIGLDPKEREDLNFGRFVRCLRVDVCLLSALLVKPNYCRRSEERKREMFFKRKASAKNLATKPMAKELKPLKKGSKVKLKKQKNGSKTSTVPEGPIKHRTSSASSVSPNSTSTGNEVLDRMVNQRKMSEVFIVMEQAELEEEAHPQKPSVRKLSINDYLNGKLT